MFLLWMTRKVGKMAKEVSHRLSILRFLIPMELPRLPKQPQIWQLVDHQRYE